MITYDDNGNEVETYPIVSGGNIDPQSPLGQAAPNKDTAIASGNYTVGTSIDGAGYPINVPGRRYIRVHGPGLTTGCIAVQNGYDQFQKVMKDTCKKTIPISVSRSFK